MKKSKVFRLEKEIEVLGKKKVKNTKNAAFIKKEQSVKNLKLRKLEKAKEKKVKNAKNAAFIEKKQSVKNLKLKNLEKTKEQKAKERRLTRQEKQLLKTA